MRSLRQIVADLAQDADVSSDSDTEEEPRAPDSFRERYRANRAFDAEASWRAWLWHRYAKYWYGIGCLILDGMVAGVVLQSTDVNQVWPYAVAIALVVGLVYLEFRGLKRFWPRRPPA